MANHDASDLEERHVNVGTAFVPNPQSAERVQPTDRPLHHPAEDAQAAAVLAVAMGDAGFNASLGQLVAVRIGVVGPVRKDFLGALHGVADLARDRWDRVDQRDQLRDIVAVGAREPNGQRKALRIRDEVMLRPIFPAIHGAGTGTFAPPTARTWLESTTAAERSIASSARSRSSNALWTLSHTPSLRQAIGLKKVPHWTTLQKASGRLLGNAAVQRLLDATVARARPRRRNKRRPGVKRSAVDSSGFEAHPTSHYFVRRRAKGRKDWQTTTDKRFPKLALLTDCSSHLVLAALAERGPGPDITPFERIVCQAHPRVRMETLLADAGYDAEWAHEVARHDLGIRSIIPPKIGRPTDKAPTGYYRRRMSQRLHLTSYGQRWQVETAFSMIKRRLGSAVNARS